jgi:hypothetical protein
MALADASHSTKSGREESRAYRCPECRGWHLTSKAVYDSPRISGWQARRPYESPTVHGEIRTKRR